MQRFSIIHVGGTDRVRITDGLTGASEEIAAAGAWSQTASARRSGAISFSVPAEVPSMKVCVIAT